MTIWCVGRNYANHAKEMGAELPTSPLIFLKSGGCLNKSHEIHLPTFSKEIHHELELALILGKDLTPQSVAVAIDLTARDVQSDLKKKGQPWAMAKSFKGACPISNPIPYESDPWFESLEFSLKINGQLRQQGLCKDMIFKPQELLTHLNQYYSLQEGDILLTGTPAGVGPLQKNDVLEAEISGQLTWSWKAL